jgi:hypothetical protein
MAAKFIDEINRLFEELVHSPWQPLGMPLAESGSPVSGDWQVDVPIRQADRGDVIVTTEGRQITIAVRRRRAQRRSSADDDVTTMAAADFRQSFLLPEGSALDTLEVGFAEEGLRIRVRLKKTMS